MTTLRQQIEADIAAAETEFQTARAAMETKVGELRAKLAIDEPRFVAVLEWTTEELRLLFEKVKAHL